MTSPVGLENVLNFRDVGKTVNDFLGKRRIREGLFYRAARPDDATLSDRQVIRDDIGVKTIIDLRTKTEHLNQAKRRKEQSSIPALVQSNKALAEPLQISGLDYRQVKVTGRAFELFLLSQLSWWDFFRVVFLFVCGYRTKAINILGQQVMIPRGLVGLGLDTLDQSTGEIREALSLYTDQAALPSLVHCTQGKDRTGLICALVLMILDVPISAIEYDYALSDEALISEREQRLIEIREIGLTDEWLHTADDMIVGIQKHLDDKYGGLNAYLDGIGFGADDRAKIRVLLLY
ncbi:tyrosine serine phosphatase [Fusarium subglutinans]|uniref:Tyrosine serine phosphatase n=1 Tax=Gibberella subglutinans TaxID=42677 RepID=A0A8H5Q274_GIBSU|nr:tyrosine serine phosphatase [Fusarium subglutinans]KAF5606899.1 tyrosine serine phosphatase [Fusarium subglutinans]